MGDLGEQIQRLRSLQDEDWELGVEDILAAFVERLEPGGAVTVEMDGVAYSIPAPLKDAFMRQADYTRKTQELAEQRKRLGL